MARGSVTKRGNLWNILYTIAPDPETGKRRQRREHGFRTKRELDTGTSLDPQKLTVAEYLEHWYETANAPNILITSAVVNERDVRLPRPCAGSGATATPATTCIPRDSPVSPPETARDEPPKKRP